MSLNQNSAEIITNSLSCGTVTTTTINDFPVYTTAYNEQTGNARRSISSSSANDNANGSGARTVMIVYLDQLFNGPFTEIITLNGTSAVNTLNTNICFVERIVVLSCGSGGVNAGTITLHGSIGGVGGPVASIAAGSMSTRLSHHYIPANRTFYLKSFACGTSGTVTSNGAVFWMSYKKLGSNTFVNVSPLFSAIGSSSQYQFLFDEEIVLTAGYVRTMVRPSTSSTITSYAFFTYKESI